MPSRRLVLTALAATSAAAAAGAWVATRPPPPVFAPGGLALGGTDPVAYFAEDRPVPGNPAHAAQWMGARWLFASAAHRNAFYADPDRWAPAYGGYCAWAVSANQTAATEPEAFTIHGGRLYLNANLRIRGRWEADREARIARADAFWPGVLENRLFG
jgi:hypothetical protein